MEELAGLPGDYAPPRGRLYIARAGEKTAGCIALRPLEGDICEMKRLYVRPEFRNLGIGRDLTLKIIEDARAIGYDRMRLDTIPKLQSAIKLYEKLGFVDIAPYYSNPIAGVRYMELRL
ncbi:MAG: GNAT family N-acetyltransferase [Planctomycetes bacterium]|nr:GNAT family N-acetyltransferase [Planctomycetota bacterium]MBI3835554.1 GNAT family N-acetyltransferase [Planctomycetota bacterium]